MKEVRLIPWCDGHDDTQVEATVERIISIDGKKPVLLDLCELCDKNVIVVAELLDRGVLADKVQPMRKAKPVFSSASGNMTLPVLGKDSLDCPHSDCEYPGAPNRSALGAHLRTIHKAGIREYPTA